MRIIAGAFGGRVIHAPKGDVTRPTSDRVREAIFNILRHPPPNARALDLYAGTGGLGFEALSRGVERVTFVDRNTEAIKAIAANAGALGVTSRVEVVRGEVHKTVEHKLHGSYAWVFIDPPYATDEAARALGLLGERPDLLAGDARVVAEHDRRRPPPEAIGPLALEDRRRYGDTEVSFYRKGEASP